MRTHHTAEAVLTANDARRWARNHWLDSASWLARGDLVLAAHHQEMATKWYALARHCLGIEG